MSRELYEQPCGEISQGDILDNLPHLYLDLPLLSVISESDEQLKSTPLTLDATDKKAKAVVANASRRRAILVTHDCTIDKPNAARWHICPILPLFELSSKLQDVVKRNRDYSKLFLPRFEALAEDSFVDFNQISTVHREIIRSARRILSLSNNGRHALYAQYVRWLTRWELRSFTCPICATEIDATAALPVRSS